MQAESIPLDVQARFWAKVDRGDPDECWEWTAGRNQCGYGLFWFGRTVGAHRVAYMIERGTIPEGLTVDHLCRNRACQNAAHMEVVTHRENVLRGETNAGINARKTHCKHGHEFTPENTYRRPGSSKRTCRACKRAWSGQERRAS